MMIRNSEFLDAFSWSSFAASLCFLPKIYLYLPPYYYSLLASSTNKVCECVSAAQCRCRTTHVLELYSHPTVSDVTAAAWRTTKTHRRANSTTHETARVQNGSRDVSAHHTTRGHRNIALRLAYNRFGSTAMHECFIQDDFHIYTPCHGC